MRCKCYTRYESNPIYQVRQRKGTNRNPPIVGKFDFVYFSQELTAKAMTCFDTYIGFGEAEVRKEPPSSGGLVNHNLVGNSYSPQGGHHRGIGKAIYLPYRALVNTLLLIVIPFQLVPDIFYIVVVCILC